MRYAKLAIVIAIGLGSAGATAQVKGVAALQTEVRDRLNPSLAGYERGIRDLEHRRDFLVRKLDIDGEVRGAIAAMTIDMQFAGTSKGNSEGWLHLDLPEGAVVTGYALDIDDVLVDGVLIDQQQGREVYERQVRRGIDPGIAEVDRNGGLNVRVYPIDQDKGRRIRVRFVAPINRQLNFPVITLPGSGTWSVTLRGIEDGATATLGGRALRHSGPLAVAAGSGRLDAALQIRPQETAALSSRHPATGERFLQLAGDLPRVPARTGGTMRIYWDRSRSMREVDLAAVLPRLKDAIAALRPSSIELVTFSATSIGRNPVAPGEGLTRAIRTISYGGASSFASS